MPGVPALDLLHALCAAFAAKDRAALLDLFTSNPVFVGSEEVVCAGRDELTALVDRYTASDVRYAFEWDRTEHRDLADTAIALAVGTEVSTGPDGEERNPYRMTVTAIRTRGDWRIAAFHGSTPYTAGAARHFT